jgi:PAS domain S-box-containing protein
LHPVKSSFFSAVSDLFYRDRLWDLLDDIYVFVKNEKKQFVAANRSFVKMCGQQKEEDILGKTDTDFFPFEYAHQFYRDDDYVLKGGRIENRVEVNPSLGFGEQWYLTSKSPVHDKDGAIIGVAGVARDVEKSEHVSREAQQMQSAIDHIHQNYQRKISIVELAQLSHLSLSQFERNFRRTFQQTPKKYIIKYRLFVACDLLKREQLSISDVAHQCGFYDHSSFSKKFFEYYGVRPKDFCRSLRFS